MTEQASSGCTCASDRAFSRWRIERARHDLGCAGAGHAFAVSVHGEDAPTTVLQVLHVAGQRAANLESGGFDFRLGVASRCRWLRGVELCFLFSCDLILVGLRHAETLRRPAAKLEKQETKSVTAKPRGEKALRCQGSSLRLPAAGPAPPRRTRIRPRASLGAPKDDPAGGRSLRPRAVTGGLYRGRRFARGPGLICRQYQTHDGHPP